MLSIKRKITWLIISLLTLITFSAALTGYRTSMEEATRLFDAELKAIALTLVSLPYSDEEARFTSPANVAWQVWQNDKLIAHSDNAPETMPMSSREGYFNVNFLGNRWRSFRLTSPATIKKYVIVAHPVGIRNALTENLILSAMTPLIISIPILALLIYWVVKNSLRPLAGLSQQLRLRQRNNLDPIDLDHCPTELEAVIATLNSLLSRLKSAFDREQQFAGNAAHELRTPLSVLKINLHNLAEAIAPDTASIVQCQQDTDRMIHVVNQLLLLSRTNPETINAHTESVNLETLAQTAISDGYARIDNKKQSIELISDNKDGPLTMQGIAFALETLLTNLIENASKYTPSGGDIRLTLYRHFDALRLNIEDSGPGIPVDQYQAVLSAFYRLPDAHTRKQTGSGLGLAIVNQIVRLHSGTLSLDTSSSLGGLAVNITLPTVAVKGGGI